MNHRDRILASARTLPEKGQTQLIAEPMVRDTLTPAQYQRLEDQFPSRITDNPTLAAIQLGQQMVLQALRRGFASN